MIRIRTKSLLAGVILACAIGPIAAQAEPKETKPAAKPAGKSDASKKPKARPKAGEEAGHQDGDKDDEKKAPPKPKVRLALRGGTVLVGDGTTIPRGTVLIEDGKIAAVGAKVEIPKGTAVQDVSGKFVFPGLIDAGSSLGFFRKEADVNKNGLDVRDGLDPFDRDLMRALAGGVTAAFISPRQVAPATGTLGAVVKFRPGGSPDSLVLEGDAAVRAGIGVSNGRTSDTVSRWKSADAVEKALKGAKSYGEAKDKYDEKLKEWREKLAEWRETNGVPVPEAEKAKDAEKANGKKAKAGKKGKSKSSKAAEKKSKKSKKSSKKSSGKKSSSSKKKRVKSRPKKPRPPRVDPAKEAMLRVLDRKIPLRIEAHRAADIRRAVALLEDYDVRLVIEGATEAHELARELKKAKVAVVTGPLALMDPRRLELAHFDPNDLAQLDGIRVALRSGDPSGRGTRFMAVMAAHAAGCGLGKERALKAVTLDAARVLGVDDRIGSLEAGKDADIVVADAHPLQTHSRVMAVMIDGKIVFGGSR